MKNKLLLSLLLFCVGAYAQVETPAKAQTKSILILNGTAHLGNGKVITDAAIAFDKGKITLVENASKIKIDFSIYDTVIKADGKHIYPGFIAPNSTLGLVEIDAVRATQDNEETGTINPNVRSIIAYNAGSKITTTVRSNGVLLGQITPRGGRISGTSSIVQLDAWNWEDAVHKENDGIHLNWADMFNRKTGKPNKEYTAQINELTAFFNAAYAYSKSITQQEKNLRFEAMRGIFDGTQTLFVHADFIKELTEAIHFARKQKVVKMVIVGGYDAWMIPEMLKENKIAVILKRVHSLPERQEDDVYLPYKLPYLLFNAGVLVCLENSGDMETMGTRNLPFYAGTTAAYGLDKEDALKLITLNTAIILGIDKTIGSIEKGKDATLFISTGDALDMKSNNVEMAFIQGRLIDIDNHQKKLYLKYSKKYED